MTLQICSGVNLADSAALDWPRRGPPRHGLVGHRPILT